MRHNCHIFEPEALHQGVVDSRRYAPFRPRSTVLIQSVGATGKSTLCNLIAASSPVFPYLLKVPHEVKPSIALCTTSNALEHNVDPISSASGVEVSLYEGSQASFSRSFGDGMFRTSSYTSSAPSSARSASEAVTLPSPLPCKQVRLLFSQKDTTKVSLMQPWIEKALAPYAAADNCCDVAFMSLKLLSAQEGNTEGLTANSPRAWKDHPLTLIECRAPDDRPAMHLTHSVVFMLSEDDAIYAARPHRTSADGSARSDSFSPKWSNRDAALVAQMTAVTTCDGDACRCCLVVNMGLMMRESKSGHGDDNQDSCNNGDQDKKALRTNSVTENDFVDISSNGSQHPAGSDLNWLSAQRTEISRRWRVSEDRVFMFSSLRLLAERLVNPAVSFDRAANDAAVLHLASEFERSEFCRFLGFLQRNASKACEEWKHRQERLYRHDKCSGLTHPDFATAHRTSSEMNQPPNSTTTLAAASSCAAKVCDVPSSQSAAVNHNRGEHPIEVLFPEVVGAPVPSTGPTRSAIDAEWEFVDSRQNRAVEESKSLASRHSAQQESVRRELAAMRAEQTAAALRVSQRQQ
jgi:hypothetical protein